MVRKPNTNSIGTLMWKSSATLHKSASVDSEKYVQQKLLLDQGKIVIELFPLRSGNPKRQVEEYC